MADSLQFNIGADTKGFTDGIGGMLGTLAGLAAAFISVQAVVEAFGNAIDLGSRLNDLSTRTGETAGNLAILERAFENNSISADKLGPALNKMQDNLVGLQRGSDSAVTAFTQLGLKWEDLKDLSPSEQLQLIGDRLAAIQDPSLRASTAIDIFGKSGAALLPMLLDFSAQTEQAKNQLGSLPELLDKSASSVDALGDDLFAIKNKLTEVAYGFLSEVVPAVEAFTSKLSGVDAASIGVGLADALIGAFADPMKAASLLGDTLVLGVKLMGNELVYQVQYWSQLMANTFSIIGSQSIPMLGNNMVGAFEMAAGTFGYELFNAIAGALTALEPIAGMLGLGDELDTSIAKIKELAGDSQNLMADGAAKIAESANKFQSAFEEAKSKSTVVRQDFFGAEDSAQKIAAKFAEIQASAHAAVEELSGGSAAMAEGRTTTGTTVDPLMNILINENKVSQTPVPTPSKTTGGMSASQLAAQQQKDLGLIAKSGSGTAIGQAYSAQKVLDLQKQMDALAAQGEQNSKQYQDLQYSIEANRAIAFGYNTTSADIAAATDWARQQYGNEYWGNTDFQDIVNYGLQNIKEGKPGYQEAQVDQQKRQEQQSGAGTSKQQQQQNSVLGIAQQLLKLMQTVEPRIPQAIMS